MTLLGAGGRANRHNHLSQLQQAPDLSGARFERSLLAGAVMRAVEIGGADIDAPWLLEHGTTPLINGIDVVPLVDAELDRRFPGRANRRAKDPDDLRLVWAQIQQTWAATLARVTTMPTGTTEVQVDGEWSFSQTLRHLVMATDTWLGRAILGITQPFHPLGQPNYEYGADGNDLSLFTTEKPTYDQVLAVRTERVGMVASFIATAQPVDLSLLRAHPWAPQYPETTLSSLHTLLRKSGSTTASQFVTLTRSRPGCRNN